MRAKIDFLDTSKMDWIEAGPGVGMKPLSRDPDTGALTSMFKVVPDDSFKDQPQAHHHLASEEIFVTDGMLTFDSKVWLHKDGYVYHPPYFVHGFKSKVASESSFIARAGAALTWTYVEDKSDHSFPYFVGETPASRDVSIVASPWTSKWEAVASVGGPIREFIYGADAANGEKTVLLRYSAGASDAPSDREGLHDEIFVQSGRLEDQFGHIYGPGCFSCDPPGTDLRRLTALEDSVVYRATFV